MSSDHQPARAAATPVAQPPRNFFQRRIGDPIVAQLTQGLTPEKIALTIAVGSAVSLFPIFGLTTLLCFLVALALRLNQPIIQAVNYGLFAVHVGSVWLCVRFGEMIFRIAPEDRLVLRPTQIYHRYFNNFWSHPFHAIWSYIVDNLDSVTASVVAWFILAAVYIPLVYVLLLPTLRKVAKAKVELAARAAAKSPEHPVP